MRYGVHTVWHDGRPDARHACLERSLIVCRHDYVDVEPRRFCHFIPLELSALPSQELPRKRPSLRLGAPRHEDRFDVVVGHHRGNRSTRADELTQGQGVDVDRCRREPPAGQRIRGADMRESDARYG